jgi:hypothetical protein
MSSGWLSKRGPKIPGVKISLSDTSTKEEIAIVINENS